MGGGGGLPTISGLEGGTYLPRWGVPTLAGGYLPRPRGTYLGRGYLPWQGGTYLGRGVPTFPGRNSIACACYMAGGMPLAFTQEDFLVFILSLTWAGH